MIWDGWKTNQVMHHDQGLVEKESGEGFDKQEKHQGRTPPWVPDSLRLLHPWTEGYDWRTRR